MFCHLQFGNLPYGFGGKNGCYPLLQWKHGEVLPTDLPVEEHPEGGANALNLNRLSGRAVHPEELQNAGALVNYMLEESLAIVQQESKSSRLHPVGGWHLLSATIADSGSSSEGHS
ncbi:unnamed protein product [Sphagnum jensenii]|uniref:Uncharacterized protein n=1 Tax=Sphagnum jensenii TaxID=128206 RepID=A0ABP1AEB5_9BRYO